MEHVRKISKHRGRELDVYDEVGVRWPIFEHQESGRIVYRLACGIEVEDLGAGAFLLPGHFHKVVRVRNHTVAK
jgi:hypothetical protein